MHGSRQPDQLAAFGFHPAFLLIEACVLGVGVKSFDMCGAGCFRMRRMRGFGMRQRGRGVLTNGVWDKQRGARKHEREHGGKDESPCGGHSRCHGWGF